MPKFKMWIGLTLFLSACAGPKDPSKVLLPRLNESGKTELAEVKLETLSDPRKVEGEAAVVYENPQSDENGFHGKPAEPRLTASDDVWVPMDVKSSAALSVYHAYELLKRFDERVIPEFSVTWPRKVAFDLQIRGGGFANNAYYQGSTDVTVILPYTAGGTAIAFNSAILAHEHFHAHFYQLFGRSVMSRLEENMGSSRCGLPNLSLSEQNDEDPRFKKALNYFILRGWNEGLADLYATLFSGVPNFLDASLFTGWSRKVNLPAGFIPPRTAVGESLRLDFQEKVEMCTSLGAAYAVGTSVARALYGGILAKHKKTFDQPLSLEEREQAVRNLFLKLSSLKDELNEQMIQEKVNPSWIVEKLSEAPPSIPGDSSTQ